MKLRFGKYRGFDLSEVDTDYLAWLSEVPVFTVAEPEEYKVALRKAITDELESRVAKYMMTTVRGLPEGWFDDVEPPKGTLLN